MVRDRPALFSAIQQTERIAPAQKATKAHEGLPRPHGETQMKAPKLLPWYARKAGVPIDRANALWRKAVRTATAETGWVGNAEYWGATVDIFLELLDAEKNTLCTPSVEPLLRSQHRMWNMPLTAMEDMFKAMSDNWQRQTGIEPRKAA